MWKRHTNLNLRIEPIKSRVYRNNYIPRSGSLRLTTGGPGEETGVSLNLMIKQMSVFSFISHQGFILTLSGCFINIQSFTEGESWENLQCFTVNIISELLSKRWSIWNFSWASITKLLGGQRGLSWRSNLINKENAPIKNHILPGWIRDERYYG